MLYLKKQQCKRDDEGGGHEKTRLSAERRGNKQKTDYSALFTLYTQCDTMWCGANAKTRR